MSDRPTYVSLFAGAGGFDIGFDAAGFRCLAQVEIDKTARAVLARHWPDVPRYEDVRTFGRDQVPTCDVLVGGFPCQDVSVAGKGKGLAGSRSGLFYEMTRIADELRPTYVVWENVPGLRSNDHGRDFLSVLVELDRLGFDGGWGTLDARHFGVPQSRKRVFGLFTRRGSGARDASEVLALRKGVRRDTQANGAAGPGSPPAPGSRVAGPGGTAPSECGGGSPERRDIGTALTAKSWRLDFDTETFVVFNCKQAAEGASVDVAPTLRAMPHDSSHANGGGQLAVCVGPMGGVPFIISTDHTGANGSNVRQDGAAGTLSSGGSQQAVCVTGTVTHTLTARGGASEDGTGRGTPIVAIPWAENQKNELRLCDVVPALQASGGGRPGHAYPAAQCGGVGGYLVRRLTPRECERLMGWPDDWTRWRADGSEIKDGPRYRLCGNGVVGTVAKWLAVRLRMVGFPDASSKEAA